ncbi:hypothetical protein DIPPA_16559 [Diplonema papillatum]|nr:hypothetical protein DIPPA_16559 [Diplonema papillatum]
MPPAETNCVTIDSPDSNDNSSGHSEHGRSPTSPRPAHVTHLKPSVAHSEHGPSVLVGGAPLPGSPISRPTPDVIYSKNKAVKHAEKHGKDVDDALANHGKHGLPPGKIHQLLHRLHPERRRNRLRTLDENQKRFALSFGVDEDVKCIFKCKYIDGKSVVSKGYLAVSGVGVHFAGEGGDPTRISIPHTTIACIKNVSSCSKISCLEQIQKPAHIDIFANNLKVYYFADFEYDQECTEDETPHDAALNWIDHMWREATELPNPSATYFTA